MKKIILIAFAITFTLGSCDQKKRYTQQSPEIDAYKKSIVAYENRNWEELASFYADTAKLRYNATKENAQTVAQMIATTKKDALIFSSWKYDPKSAEYEMVVTDKGETWVNFWGNWEGTLKANNKVYVIPASLTAQFIDGKIVREDGYWDNTKLMMDMQKLQDTTTQTAVVP